VAHLIPARRTSPASRLPGSVRARCCDAARFRAELARAVVRLKDEGCSGGRSRASRTEGDDAFVAFDVAKMKHAVAIAEGGRTGEVRFLGEIENRPGADDQEARQAV
jgi:hypothetical protein